MVTITRKEEIVLERIRVFDPEFEDGIPMKVLQDDLDIHEHNLHDILKALAFKELVKYENKTVKLINADIEVNSVATKSDVRSLELDQKKLMH